jgi:hypothetical protein
MPKGKPAGVRCNHLTDENLCDLYKSMFRPKVCINFKPDYEFCGDCREEAMEQIAILEKMTAPQS